MKKVDLSNIVPNVRGLILEDETLAHIIESYQEGFESILSALNCNPSSITILSGAVVDDSAAPDFAVTAGWAAYGGEVFQIDAVSFTASVGQTAVWSIETIYRATDPVKFDDGNEFNINAIRKLKLQSGVSGSGTADYDAAESIASRIDDLLALQTKIDAVVDSAPANLDTLNKIAAALGNDSGFVTTITNQLANKLDNTQAVNNSGNTGANTQIKMKIIEIGDWDMQTNHSVLVNHNLTYSSIRSVSVSIRSDEAGSNNRLYSSSVDPGALADGTVTSELAWFTTTTQVFIERKTGGVFDAPGFNDTSYNRGFITIIYEE